MNSPGLIFLGEFPWLNYPIVSIFPVWNGCFPAFSLHCELCETVWRCGTLTLCANIQYAAVFSYFLKNCKILTNIFKILKHALNKTKFDFRSYICGAYYAYPLPSQFSFFTQLLFFISHLLPHSFVLRLGTPFLLLRLLHAASEGHGFQQLLLFAFFVFGALWTYRVGREQWEVIWWARPFHPTWLLPAVGWWERLSFNLCWAISNKPHKLWKDKKHGFCANRRVTLIPQYTQF